MKKTFTKPLVFLTEVLETVPGGYSQPGGNDWNSLKPVPMSFGEWSQSRFVSDYDANPGVDFDDYAKWFSDSGFGTDTWNVYNPGSELVEETK